MSKTKSKNQGREAISQRAREAAESVQKIISSIGMTMENKIAIEDQIKNLSHETESMLFRVDDIARAHQRKILTAYKKFLEHNLDAVNERLKGLD
jgi:hypothetical protein